MASNMSYFGHPSVNTQVNEYNTIPNKKYRVIEPGKLFKYRSQFENVRDIDPSEMFTENIITSEEIVDRWDKEAKARAKYPALQLAYEQYQILLALTAGDKIYDK